MARFRFEVWPSEHRRITQHFGQPHEGKFYGLFRSDSLKHQDRKPVYDKFKALCDTELDLPLLTADAPDGARFVPNSDLVKDGTTLLPGESFTQQWKMLNNGGTTWGAGYRLAAIDESMGAPPFVEVPTTAPGQVATFTIEHVAPMTPGLRRST